MSKTGPTKTRPSEFDTVANAKLFTSYKRGQAVWVEETGGFYIVRPSSATGDDDAVIVISVDGQTGVDYRLIKINDGGGAVESGTITTTATVTGDLQYTKVGNLVNIFTPQNGLVFATTDTEFCDSIPVELQNTAQDRDFPFSWNATGGSTFVPKYLRMNDEYLEINGSNSPAIGDKLYFNLFYFVD